MKSVSMKIAIFILMAGLLSACGGQSTNTPASQPSETAVSALSSPTGTEAPTDAPTVTEPATAAATEPATATQPAAQGATVSFAKDVLPIFQSRCINCHGGDRTEKGLSLKTYDTVMSGSENGPAVTPGNAADSKLVELIVNQKMPKRGPKLTPPQVQLIADWVNQGAQNN